MYPKQQRKKRRKIHPASILHPKDGTCYLCMRLNGEYRQQAYTEEHHAYDGPNRVISEANGFKVYLCRIHHRSSPEAVHENAENMRLIQRDMQKKYEETHSREEFMNLIGRNYLED